MRLVLCLVGGFLFCLPIGFWALLLSYYGWVPAEARVFDLDLRTVLVCISSLGFVVFMIGVFARLPEPR